MCVQSCVQIWWKVRSAYSLALSPKHSQRFAFVFVWMEFVSCSIRALRVVLCFGRQTARAHERSIKWNLFHRLCCVCLSVCIGVVSQLPCIQYTRSFHIYPKALRLNERITFPTPYATIVSKVWISLTFTIAVKIVCITFSSLACSLLLAFSARHRID